MMFFVVDSKNDFEWFKGMWPGIWRSSWMGLMPRHQAKRCSIWKSVYFTSTWRSIHSSKWSLHPKVCGAAEVEETQIQRATAPSYTWAVPGRSTTLRITWRRRICKNLPCTGVDSLHSPRPTRIWFCDKGAIQADVKTMWGSDVCSLSFSALPDRRRWSSATAMWNPWECVWQMGRTRWFHGTIWGRLEEAIYVQCGCARRFFTEGLKFLSNNYSWVIPMFWVSQGPKPQSIALNSCEVELYAANAAIPEGLFFLADCQH